MASKANVQAAGTARAARPVSSESWKARNSSLRGKTTSSKLALTPRIWRRTKTGKAKNIFADVILQLTEMYGFLSTLWKIEGIGSRAAKYI
jgi:hypothetical protein